MLLFDSLRQTLDRNSHSVVFIIGTGVSAGALDGSPRASLGTWKGLLTDGLERIHGLGLINDELRSHYLQQLEFTDDLVGVANVLYKRLGAPDGGEYSRWLRETAGSFHKDIRVRAVLDALAVHQGRGVMLATTNYDHLLEAVTDLKPATWRRPADVERAISGEEPRILHLHGSWVDPDSVVLGTHSYLEVVKDPHAQAVLTALRTSRTFVFIGCGAGLHDPNIGAFLKWTGEAFARSEGRHFRLCLQKDVEAIRREHPAGQRIYPLVYGSTHADLAPFLISLLPPSVRTDGAERPPGDVMAVATNSAKPDERDQPRTPSGSTMKVALDPASTMDPFDDGKGDDADALIDDLGSLLASAAVDFVRPIVRITGLPEETVRARLESANDRSVKDLFKTAWPNDEALGDYTVAQVRRWQLTGAVARFLGLPYSDVQGRLAEGPGQTKVRRLFSRRWPKVQEADEVDSEAEADGEEASTFEDIEVKNLKFIRRHDLAGLIAEITGQAQSWVEQQLKKVHGRTLVLKAFRDHWPDSAALGSFTAASCIRLGLVVRVASILDRSPANIQMRLEGVPGQTKLRTVFNQEWPGN